MEHHFVPCSLHVNYYNSITDYCNDYHSIMKWISLFISDFFFFWSQFFFTTQVYGHVSWTRLQKRWFCYAFFIFTPFKCWYLSQIDRYCHESGLILKLIKGSIPPVNMRSIAFQMAAGCVLEWRMVRVVEGGEAEGGEAVHTNSMGKSRFARVLHVKLE